MDCSSEQRQMITEPLLSNGKGGIRTIPFILANEAFERLASFGLSTNMIMYLTREYGMDAAQGAQLLLLFSSVTNFTPILGAVLADSYVGRYRMIGFGCMASLLENKGWMVGFGVPVVLMILPALSFSLASPFYVKSKPKASWITGLAQVVVASFRNRSVELSTQATVEVFQQSLHCWKSSSRRDSRWKCFGSMESLYSRSSRRSENTDKGNPNMVMRNVDVCEFLVMVVWVALYDRIIILLVSKIKGQPLRLDLKKRTGIGILLSTSSMAALAIAESVRRETAIKEGFSDRPDAGVHISTFLLLPFLALSGVAEAFTPIGQNEFFYTELPKSMSSVASTLNGIGMSVASLVSSFIVRAVRDLTTVEGQESWVSSNINKGHYNYYYWLLASLSLVNFLYYLVCSKSYGPSMEEQKNIVADESY
ncbi:hypothetical protein Peur_067939 [Populus x canadensis]